MIARRESRLAGAASLAISLALAALLAVITATADSHPPAKTEPPRDTARAPQPPAEADLSVVYLPPPPETAPRPQPVAEPEAAPEPPAPEPPPEPAVAETSVPKAAVTAVTPPLPPAPPPQAEPQPVAITPESIREGRALLRLLERGEGPDIEIAWPAAAADRADLYRLFSDCFGMRTVIIGPDGNMYGAGTFDGDRYSGFARQPTGSLSGSERSQVDVIRDRHGVDGGSVLHLFPRRVDAILLGALQRIVGDDFARGVRIRARYRAAADGVQVTGIQVVGRAVNDVILLPYDALRTCRRGLAR